jgi:hypothetical protein
MTSSTADKDNGLEIYKRLARAWDVASVDRDVSYKEVVLVPIFDSYAQVGAALLIATLCYPESRDKRHKLVNALGALIVKSSATPNSAQRKQLRDIHGLDHFLDIPNKRINQTVDDGIRRLHTRFRAAWVLAKKLISSNEPSTQAPLRELMLEAARQNTRHFPAFASNEGDDQQIIDSFRQRVMAPTRPVAHLSLALYQMLIEQDITANSILNLVLTAENWLAELVEKAEIYRVSFGDMFPSQENQYLATRNKNYGGPLSETVAVLPFIDPIDPAMGWEAITNLEHQTDMPINR